MSPLVGAQLGGGPAWAGSPAALYQGGAAVLAYVWGLSMDRLGRRPTLAIGVGVGALGALLASAGVARALFPLFLVGVSCMGMAYSALQLGRFVAAEVSVPARRARALATVVFGGTVGAVLGSLLAGPAGALVKRHGVDELAGPYLASALLLLLVSGLLLLWLRPEPRGVAAAVAAQHGTPGAGEGGVARPLGEIARQPRARVAVVTLVMAQAIMVMLMVITGVHMKDHAHALHDISFVFAAHVVGMYALSVPSGRMTDARGPRAIIVAGSLVLFVACLLAPLSPRVVPLALSLFLLGWGWNLCYVAGSALLSSELRPVERARMQGINDLLMGSASAAGALGSGVVFGAVGYRAMALASGGASLLLFLLALGGRETPQGAAGA